MELVSCILSCFFFPYVVSANIDPRIQHFPSSDSVEDIEEVNNLLLDEDNNQIIFSALNSIFAISLDLKTKKKKVDISPLGPSCNSNNCGKERVTSMISDSNYLITCATSKMYSLCWRFQKSDLLLDSEWSKYGQKLAPGLKLGEKSEMILTKPFIFSTGMYSDSISGVSKFKYPEVDDRDTVRIKTIPSQISDGATFISAYEFDNSQYIYFFFKETVKYDSRESWVISNVARVCKYDEGGPITSSAGARFVTFLKSRLVCSKQTIFGDKKVTFYYDQLTFSYEVSLTNQNGVVEKFIYAIFTESRETGTISAFCRYRVSDIVAIFNASPLKDKSGDRQDMPPLRSKLSRGTCQANMDVPQNTDFLDSTALALLYNKVESVAFFRLNNVSFKTMVVGNIVAKSLYYIFAGADNGKVYKIFITNNGDGLIVDTITPFENSTEILSLILVNDTVYAGGVHKVAMFNVQRCEEMLFCSSCIQTRDPHCGWSLSDEKCMLVGENSLLLQDLETGNDSLCPKKETKFGCHVVLVKADIHKQAVLRCLPTSEDGKNKPKVVQWHKYDKNIFPEPNSHYSVNSNMEELRVDNYTEKDMGLYKCIVELNNLLDSCSVELKAINRSNPATESTTTPLLTTMTTVGSSSTSDGGVVTNVSPVPGTGDDLKNGFFNAFVFMLVLFVIALFIIVLLIFVAYSYRRQSKHGLTDVDGANGSLKNSFSLHCGRKNKANTDSSNKELLKKNTTTDLDYKQSSKADRGEIGYTETAEPA